MLSVLFGAGAACGTADFMGESKRIHVPVIAVALLRYYIDLREFFYCMTIDQLLPKTPLVVFKEKKDYFLAIL